MPQIGFTGSCETGLCISQKLWPSFGSLLLSKQHLVKLEKSLTKLRFQYCLDMASKHWKDLLQTQLQCNIFSSCNPLPFNNCELSLPLRLFQHCQLDQHNQVLPDYVIHSLVKMLSQTKLIVLPLRTKTNRHPNKNQCKILWLSLFAKEKPFRDYFFLPLRQRAMQRNAKSNVISLWEVKQYASTSLQNYLTLFICQTETCPWLFFPLPSTTSHATPNV